MHGRSNEGRAPFCEDDILPPRGLYGMSKAAAEAELRTLASDSDMNISVIRPPLLGSLFGLLGRQDTHDRLIGSLELNVSKAIETERQPEVSLDEGLRLALAAQDA